MAARPEEGRYSPAAYVRSSRSSSLRDIKEFTWGLGFSIPHKKLSNELEKESLPLWKINGVGKRRKLLPETNYRNGLRIINLRKGRSDTNVLICDEYMMEVAIVA